MNHHIENPAAYASAVSHRIAVNGIKGRFRRLRAERPDVVALMEALNDAACDRHDRMVARLEAKGEWAVEDGWDPRPWPLDADMREPDPEGTVVSFTMTITDSPHEDWGFGDKLVASWLRYGKLSPKQAEWVTKLTDQIRGRAAKDAAEAEARKGSRHVGSVGERLALTLTVRFTKTLDGYMPNTSKMMVSFVDGDRNEYVTFGTGEILWGLSRGDIIDAKATVKEHGEYQGIQQTTLTRVAGTVREETSA